MAAPERPPTDWESIEKEYRAGQLSVAEIARQHSISHVAIHRKAKKLGWERNLADRIKEAVTTRLVTDGVTGNSARETVELAAARGVHIVREHRTLIARGHKATNGLFGELENTDEVGLKDKSIILGNLTSAMKTLIALERHAFNLDATPDDAGKLEVSPSAAFAELVGKLEGVARAATANNPAPNRVVGDSET